MSLVTLILGISNLCSLCRTLPNPEQIGQTHVQRKVRFQHLDPRVETKAIQKHSIKERPFNGKPKQACPPAPEEARSKSSGSMLTPGLDARQWVTTGRRPDCLSLERSQRSRKRGGEAERASVSEVEDRDETQREVEIARFEGLRYQITQNRQENRH